MLWEDETSTFGVVVQSRGGVLNGRNLEKITIRSWSAPIVEPPPVADGELPPPPVDGKPRRSLLCETEVELKPYLHELGLNKSETLMAREAEEEPPPPPMAFSPIVIPAVPNGVVEFTTNEGITEFYYIFASSLVKIPIRVFIIGDIPAKGDKPRVDTGGPMADGAGQFGGSKFKLLMKPREEVVNKLKEILVGKEEEGEEERKKALDSVKKIWEQKEAVFKVGDKEVTKKIEMEIDKFKFNGKEPVDFIVVWNPDDLEYLQPHPNPKVEDPIAKYYVRSMFQKTGEMKVDAEGKWVVKYMLDEDKEKEKRVDLTKLIMNTVNQYAEKQIQKCIDEAATNEEKQKWKAIMEEWKKPALYLFIPRKLDSAGEDTLGIGRDSKIGAVVDNEKFTDKKDAKGFEYSGYVHIIVAHEFGHNLSLPHEYGDEGNLMNPAIGPRVDELEEWQIKRAIEYWEKTLSKEYDK